MYVKGQEHPSLSQPGEGDGGAENRYMEGSNASLNGVGEDGSENKPDESSSSSSFTSSDGGRDDGGKGGWRGAAVCLKIDNEKSLATIGIAWPDDGCAGCGVGADGRGVEEVWFAVSWKACNGGATAGCCTVVGLNEV